jgi:uncharacterized protein YqhQ
MGMKNVGGQAVIEGVMMKASSAWTVAVRNPQGEIIVKREELNDGPRFLKGPLIRGAVGLIQAMILGIKALSYSAEISMEEEHVKKSTVLSRFFTVFLSLVLAMGLFFVLPLYMTKLLGLVINVVQENTLVFNCVDGIVRIGIFVAYIFSISLIKDIKRVFEYHGAEHKVIHAYEAGVELRPENTHSFSTLHPRCGTSFLLIVMVMSIFVFSFIPNEWLFIDKLISRFFLIPLIASLSYEFIRFSSYYSDNPIVKFLIFPGLLLQKVTTRPPSDEQIEVAIRALKDALDTGKRGVSCVT